MGAGFTLVQYGSVTFYQCTTEDVTQDSVFDESNTDLLYVKTRITISGFVHGHKDWDYQLVTDGSRLDYGGSAAGAQTGARRRLEPRANFLMYTGCSGEGQLADGEVLFDVQAMPLNLIVPSPPRVAGNISLVGYDLNNGPKNISFTVHNIAGNEVFRVRAIFELCHLECPYEPGQEQNSYGVLSNRWSCRDSLDTNLQISRTYVGQLVCASQNINIHSFRWMTVPTLQPLMRIESMNFEASRDGLRLNWTITHKEMQASAPWPARDWNVVHRESLIDGMKSDSSVDVDLYGDSQTDKGRLITLAYWIIFAKTFGKTPNNIMALSNAINPRTGISFRQEFLSQYVVKNFVFTDFIGQQCHIHASATIQRRSENINDVTKAFGNLGLELTQDNDLPPPRANDPNRANEPNYDRTLSWGAYPGQKPEFEGPARLAGLFACFLQTPCDDRHSLFKPVT